MTKPMIRIHDISTDEVIDREMNEEEFAQWKLDEIEQSARIKALNDKASHKAALLEKLGISADEAELLLS